MPLFQSSYITIKYFSERVIYFPTWLAYTLLHIGIFQVIINV